MIPITTIVSMTVNPEREVYISIAFADERIGLSGNHRLVLLAFQMPLSESAAPRSCPCSAISQRFAITAHSV